MNSPTFPSETIDSAARVQAAVADFRSESDPQKLARIIEQNQVILKQGWNELERLSQLLEKLDAQLKGLCSKVSP